MIATNNNSRERARILVAKLQESDGLQFYCFTMATTVVLKAKSMIGYLKYLIGSR